MATLRRSDILYTSFVFLIALFVLAAAVFYLRLGYDELIRLIVSVFHKNGLESFLRNQVFPESKYELIRKFCYAAMILLPLIVFFLIRVRRRVQKAVDDIRTGLLLNYRDLVAAFRDTGRAQRIIWIFMILVLFLRGLYYLNSRDLQYDEMWSYNYFTAQPFYYTFFMYNNYPLYEIFTSFFKWLPFSAGINLRLPVLLSGLFTCFLLYSCLNARFKNHWAGLAGMAGFAFFPLATCYMLYGRGVMIEMPFACAALFSIAFWIRRPERKDRLVIFVIANIAGLYAMPTHVYLWILLIVVSLMNGLQKLYIRSFVSANMVILLGALLCYLPVALGSGFAFLTKVISQPLTMAGTVRILPGYFFNTSAYMFGISVALLLMILACLLLLVSRRQSGIDRFLVLCTMGLCLLPFVCLMFQRFLIPPRAFGYVSLAPALLIAVGFDRFRNRLNPVKNAALVLCIATAGLFISHFHQTINWSRNIDRESKHVAEILLQNKVRTCYDLSTGSPFPYYYPAVEFYYRQEHRIILLTLNAKNSIRYRPFDLKDTYDCIIINTGDYDALTFKQYKPVYSDPKRTYIILLLRSVES